MSSIEALSLLLSFSMKYMEEKSFLLGEFPENIEFSR